MNEEFGKDSEVELLAPGGSMEGIRAAVNAGADAIYAGGRFFGARAYAQNPEDLELLEAIDYCHLHGAKLYLTVNTLLKEQELMKTLPEYLAPICEHGVDAVLVQDFGVFHFLRKEFPELPLHASTQMTITGPDGVKLLQEMGAERVVLSRELSLEEIRQIRRECDVELETFVHGALCYCYSGQCLMSSLLGGRSGNRGRCAQPCRLPYNLCDSRQGARSRRMLNQKEDMYLLSPKDICTLDIIPDLVDAGIASLKIEGRMKSPEYAAGVTAMYRKYIDLYLKAGREDYRVAQGDKNLLTELFSRGEYSQGYYHERNGRDMIVLTEQDKSKGAGLRHAQETVASIRSRYVDIENKIQLQAFVRIREGEPATMTLTDHAGNSYTAEGFAASWAMSRPADQASVLKQINKTGNTDFEFESIEIDLQEGLFVQVRDLNDLRRRAIEGIREVILRPYKRPADKAGVQDANGDNAGVQHANGDNAGVQHVNGDNAGVQGVDGDNAGVQKVPGRKLGTNIQGLYMGGYKSVAHPEVTASVRTEEQLDAVLQRKEIGGVYLDYAICTLYNVRRVWDSGRKVYLMMPQIWRLDTAKRVMKMMEDTFGAFGPVIKASVDGILVRSFDQLYTLKTAGLLNDADGFEVIADAGLYTWNKHARQQLTELGVTMDTLPWECSSKELQERGCENSEFVIYGYQNLMVSAQCLVKTVTGCSHEPSVHYLRDRKGVLFPVVNDCRICTNTIYNSVPLELISLSGQVKALKPSSVRYMFTVESRDEILRVLKGNLPDEVTRGHFRKGAE